MTDFATKEPFVLGVVCVACKVLVSMFLKWKIAGTLQFLKDFYKDQKIFPREKAAQGIGANTRISEKVQILPLSMITLRV